MFEWEFKEKVGSKDNFYFSCTTNKCLAFGMINRNDNNRNFKLTKEHNISYALHSYNNINNINQIFKTNDFKQEDWDNLEFRRNYINWYFNNYAINENECFNFINSNLQGKINIGADIKKDIKSVRISINLKNRAQNTIINKLLNLKDQDDNIICTNYQYESVNKRTKEKCLSNLFLIITKLMIINLCNIDISQYFGDTIYIVFHQQ